MGGFVAPLTGHLNVALTNFAKQYRQNGLVSDLVAPRVPVERETDKYYIWDRAHQMLNFDDLRAPGAPAETARRAVSDDSYHCRSHALQAPLPDESRVNAEQAGLGQMVSAQGRVQFLQGKILLKKEYNLAAMMALGNFLSTQRATLVGTDQWTDASSNPAAVVAAAKKLIRRNGVEANLMVIGEDVYDALCLHPTILGRFQYVQRGIIDLSDLAAYFKIAQVVVAGAVKVAVDGTTPSVVWDADDVLICYADPNPSTEDLSFMKTFVWSQAPGTVGGYGVVQGRAPDPTAKSDTVGVDFYYDMKITAQETGYLIKDAT